MLGIKRFGWKKFFDRLYEKANQTDVFGNAAQVGFYFSFAFFPLVLFLLTLTGILLGTSDGVQRHLFLYLADVMPPSAFELVRTTIDEVIANSTGGKLTIGALVTL